MLTSVGIDSIDILHDGREATIQELADEAGHSTSHVYQVVDELQEAGMITEYRGHHNQRILRAADHPVIEAYRNVTSKLGHVAWADLLSPATIRVCWFLDEPRHVTTIAERLGRTRQSVHHALSPLKNRAMLSPSGPEYALVPDLRPLLDFVRAVITHEHRIRARRHAPSATVEWYDPKRALVHVHNSDDTDALQDADGWEITGLARFEAFGLQFFLAGEPAFWYGPDEEVTPAEIVCHSLVRDTGSRRVSYALLLIEHAQIDADTLIDTAEWYDLETTASDMCRFIQEDANATDDMDTTLPTQSEYEALKSQYGVA